MPSRQRSAPEPGRCGPAQIPLAGTIRAAEIDLIRRILTAFGGEGAIAITRGEAEALFEIDEALAASALNPAWTDLFAKAIGNAMMAAAGYAVPSREEALRAATSTDAADDDLSAGTLTASCLCSLRTLYHEQSQEERGLTRLERQRIEIITGEAHQGGRASLAQSRASPTRRPSRPWPRRWPPISRTRWQAC